MKNTEFLRKAENLKPELIRTCVELKGEDRLLNAGDEAVYDFGNHYAGYLQIAFDTAGHHPDAPLLFSVQFAEIAQELDHDPESYHGWISGSWLQEERIHMDVLPGVCRLERRYAFRYVRIRIIAASDNYSVRIDGLKAEGVSSADESKLKEVKMPEKDRELDRIACRTLHNCMQDVFEDGPKRDRRLWLGDLRLEALTNYETYRNYDLVKRCLYLFAGSTLENGRLASNIFTEPEPECDFQTMFDYTLFYISTLWDYYCRTHERQTLKDLEPVCMKQYELLQDCFDEKGLLDTEKAGRIFIDWNLQLDKQAAGQAVWIYAVRDLIQIENELGKYTPDLEKDLKRKEKAAASLYDREKGLFVSGKNRQISWASQIWMILAGVVTAEGGRLILENAEKEPGIRHICSPYMQHHYIQALLDIGMEKEAYEKMHRYWGGMIGQGTDTFWELYNPQDPLESPYGGIVIHSFCHAWSCTPAYFLRKYFCSERQMQ
ncbi:MAG: hypothetical protein IJ130_11470 [Solobacterium sp.]|nr:hypothetical protein [Solobacterium sp.]